MIVNCSVDALSIADNLRSGGKSGDMLAICTVQMSFEWIRDKAKIESEGRPLTTRIEGLIDKILNGANEYVLKGQRGTLGR